MMFAVIIWAVTLTAVYGQYLSAENGWMKQHKVAATWDEAYNQCLLEGAVLASPITLDLRYQMKSMIGEENPKYFIGTSARFIKNIFASIEGVPLHNMPVLDMIEKLNPEDGRCLGMSSSSISVVPCSSHLPYICYKKRSKNMVLTDCGTYDGGYKFVASTGSCYKTHSNQTLWADAYRTCIAEGGYLAIINDVSEAKMLIKDVINSKSHYLLVGLEDWNGTDEWKSLHGHPIDEIYNVWESASKPSTSNRCGTINPNTAELKAFGNCLNNIFFFLCEKDPKFTRFPTVDVRAGVI